MRRLKATCQAQTEQGARCRQAPLRSGRLCFWHDPDNAREADEARRLGGLRRRREGAVAGAYDFEGLDSAEQIRRILNIAITDALALDNSIARSRVLIHAASAAARLLEVGELEERVKALEAAVGSPALPEPVFDRDQADNIIEFVEKKS